MRVVQVNCARDLLGRESFELLDAWPTLGSVASAVARAGAAVTVVQSSDEDRECEREGVQFHFVREPWLGTRPAAGYAPRRIAKAVKSLKPDIVHINGLGFPFHTRRLCSLGVPVLAQDHSDAPRGRLGVLRRWGLAKIAAAAFTSAELAEPFFSNRTLKPGTPVFSLPESSTHFRSGDVGSAREKTNIHGNPCVLWVGHLNENKDPLTIIEAVSRAARRLPAIQLWLCYKDAPLYDRVNARLNADPDLASHVHLLGSLSHGQIEWLCRAADFFMSGSRRESCGYALLEALACGATPIVTNIPAFRALTANGKVGAVCNPGDADAFANALISLALCDPPTLRTRAMHHFESELSFQALGKKLLAAYETVADMYVAERRPGR